MKNNEIEKYREDGDMMNKVVDAIDEANMDEIAAYNAMQRLKAETDYNISMELAKEEGLSLGEAKGKAETESGIRKKVDIKWLEFALDRSSYWHKSRQRNSYVI